MAQVKIGDRTFPSTEEALKALNADLEAAKKQAAEALVAQQKAEATAAATASATAVKQFALSMSKYSMTHEKTVPALRGKLKGSIQIVDGSHLSTAFGLHIFPAAWDVLMKHREAIDAYVNEHRAELAKAESEAKRIKGTEKA